MNGQWTCNMSTDNRLPTLPPPNTVDIYSKLCRGHSWQCLGSECPAKFPLLPLEVISDAHPLKFLQLSLKFKESSPLILFALLQPQPPRYIRSQFPAKSNMDGFSVLVGAVALTETAGRLAKLSHKIKTAPGEWEHYCGLLDSLQKVSETLRPIPLICG